MTELYINKQHVYEYWQYTEGYTADKLPEWLKTDDDLEIFQRDDKLIILDKVEYEYRIMYYGDYIIKNIRNDFIEYLGDDGDPVIVDDQYIVDHFIPYGDKYFIRKCEIIEAYKYFGHFDFDNLPEWVKKCSFKMPNDILGIYRITTHTYITATPKQYIFRYLYAEHKPLEIISYFYRDKWMLLDEKNPIGDK